MSVSLLYSCIAVELSRVQTTGGFYEVVFYSKNFIGYGHANEQFFWAGQNACHAP